MGVPLVLPSPPAPGVAGIGGGGGLRFNLVAGLYDGLVEKVAGVRYCVFTTSSDKTGTDLIQFCYNVAAFLDHLL